MASERGHRDEAPLFGVAAEFDTAASLLDGVRRLEPRRFGRMDAHTPVPVVGLSDALGAGGSLGPFAIGGVVLGFVATMGMCIYATAYDYVFDIGGRPLVSWPAFMVPSISFAMLTGTLAVYLAMLFTNRLPRLNHPAFNIPNFTRASQDAFFLTIAPQEKPLDVAAIEAAFNALPHPPVAFVRVPR